MLLAVRGLRKSFGPVRALRGADFTVERGQVHALMGENGAGKSTLIKCLSGVHQADSGTIVLGGREIVPLSPRHAESLGISTVFQEVSLIPHMTVAENVTLGRETTTRWLRRIDRRAACRRAEQALRRLGIEIDVRAEVASRSIAHQQLVAIARALDVRAGLLILDEPTSSLDRREVAQLFEVIQRLKSQGLGIVFITHFLDQVYAVSDRITILRDGAVVGEHAASEIDRHTLVSRMIGREFSAAAEPVHGDGPAEASDAFYKASELSRRGSVEGVSVQIEPGDAVGLAGLLGSGRTEAARLLFGADVPTGGRLELDGKAVRLGSPGRALRLRLAMTPEDRKALGIIPSLSVRENILLALQARRGMLRPVPRGEARRLVQGFIEALGIKTPSPDAAVSTLSGGNQQKVLLARWLATEPRLLILDEPTRGIDVGAKAEIERFIESLRRRGMAVVLVGSDLEELVRVCRRVLVMRDRRQVAELAAGPGSIDAVMSAIAAGHAPRGGNSGSGP
ncbi:MAG: sugar ABC transporter ATP-binding protein [Phycisphaerae bacterium]